ncbi:MAG: MFS transporter [Bacteroidetes bacterium 46-16]|nr:MAG: MFS transporter [Bacteroidetes bacterium 46-16]
MKAITRTILVLSLVSLFTDVASEMLYPIMPVYLESIHFSLVLIGVLEGMAEAIAGLSKGYFGKLSDNRGRRVPYIRLGYGLSALSKPMMAIFTFPIWIFSARSMDRIGKGIRTGARDAMLSDEATPQTKGTVFGFHRAMDTLGAVLGPLAALVFLYYRPGQYKSLFLLAFIPGVIAIAFTLLVKDKNVKPKEKVSKTRFLDFIRYWKASPAQYRKLLIGLLFFALFNSSDVFLLLKIKDAGISDTSTIGAYVFYNIVYAAVSFPLGILADRVGLKKIFISGLLVFAIVYAGMGFSNSLYGFFAFFFLYGIYAAATEGIAKAWISNISDKKDTATAIGTYTAFQSICTLLASTLTGLLWMQLGPGTTFIIIASATVLAAGYITVVVKRR